MVFTVSYRLPQFSVKSINVTIPCFNLIRFKNIHGLPLVSPLCICYIFTLIFQLWYGARFYDVNFKQFNYQHISHYNKFLINMTYSTQITVFQFREAMVVHLDSRRWDQIKFNISGCRLNKMCVLRLYLTRPVFCWSNRWAAFYNKHFGRNKSFSAIGI